MFAGIGSLGAGSPPPQVDMFSGVTGGFQPPVHEAGGEGFKFSPPEQDWRVKWRANRVTRLADRAARKTNRETARVQRIEARRREKEDKERRRPVRPAADLPAANPQHAAKWRQ